MWFLIVLLAIFGIFFGFLAHGVSAGNPLFSYTFSLILFFITQPVVLILTVLVVGFFSLRTSSIHGHYNLGQLLITVIIQVFSIVFIGFAIGFGALLIIAFLQLNVTAIAIDMNPHLFGLTSDKKNILVNLQSNTLSNIVASDQDSSKETLAVSTVTTGTSNLYGNTLLPAIPGFLIIPVPNSSSGMFYIDGTLIITDLNANNFQSISPYVGYQLVQQYFPTRHIKSFPKISVMTQQQYRDFAQKDSQNKYQKVILVLSTIDDQISSISADITNDTDQLNSQQKILLDSSLQIEKQYSNCVNKGSYVNSVYVKTNTTDICKPILSNLDTLTTSSNTTITNLEKKQQNDNQQLTNYKYYRQVFAAQNAILSVATANIPDELGMFKEPDQIKIDLSSTDTNAVIDYFETLTHEYLHYASYQNGNRFDSNFFEEGLTEYFARRIIKNDLDIDTHNSYPAQVFIVSQMAKVIPETDLEDIYFTKDQIRLQQSLDNIYGEGFYQRNAILFDTLQYTSDPEQELKLTNTILNHIGLSPVSKKELENF